MEDRSARQFRVECRCWLNPSPCRKLARFWTVRHCSPAPACLVARLYPRGAEHVPRRHASQAVHLVLEIPCLVWLLDRGDAPFQAGHLLYANHGVVRCAGIFLGSPGNHSWKRASAEFLAGSGGRLELFALSHACPRRSTVRLAAYSQAGTACGLVYHPELQPCVRLRFLSAC